MPRQAKKTAGFESLLKELETIVNTLSAGDLQLDEALAAYQKGVTLADAAEKELKAAEDRVKVLNGSMETVFVPGEADDGHE